MKVSVSHGVFAFLSVCAASPASPASRDAQLAPAVTWSSCPPNEAFNDTSTIQCANFTVPLNHSDLSAGTIRLTAARLKATNGSATPRNLFMNSGGPGLWTTNLLRMHGDYENTGNPINKQFSNELRANFDIIGLDMRGEGLSQPIFCDPTAYKAPHLMGAIDDDTFEQLWQHNEKFAYSCANLTGPFFHLIGTDQVIQDLEHVRRALGDGKLNYMGYSYGTQLGAQYLEKYPTAVDQMILDGNLDHSATVPQAFIEEAIAVESTLNFFFTWCNATADCSLHGEDQPAIWDELLAKADQGTLLQATSLQCNKTPCESQAEQFLFVAQGALELGNHAKRLPGISTTDFFAFADALNQSRHGDTSFFEPAATVNSTSSAVFKPYSFPAIYCSDWTNTIRSAGDMRALFEVARAQAPRTRGISGKSLAKSGCVGWPFKPTNPERRLNFTNVTNLPRVMLVSSLYDEATPALWTVQQRFMIPTAFNIWRNGGGHTSYHLFGDTQKAMDAFLLNSTIPQDGAVYRT